MVIDPMSTKNYNIFFYLFKLYRGTSSISKHIISMDGLKRMFDISQVSVLDNIAQCTFAIFLTLPCVKTAPIKSFMEESN